MTIDQILDQMTLDEQVALLAGADFWQTVPVPRLGVPAIKVSDGPNGARGGGGLSDGTKAAAFPCGVALGAGWNPDAARRMGGALAAEARSKGARVLLAPTVNIHRSGLNGRNFECYSEDPCLTSALAVGYIGGLQADGVAATVKHFAANDSEIERQTISSDVDERALREIYLPPFEAAVKEAGVMAVMSGYNRINGTYASENHWLLTEVLRGEWGFDGLVMSDWFGTHAGAETVNAGLDLEMPGPERYRGAKLVAAVQDGRVATATVREAARRVLTLIERVGGFDAAGPEPETAVDRLEDRALIRRLGADGAVLLKNDGILPLDPASLTSLAAIGPNAAVARIMGGGSAQINAHHRVTPLEGLRAALGAGVEILHAPGCGNDRLVREFEGEMQVAFYNSDDYSGDPVAVEPGQVSNFFWFALPDGVDFDRFSTRVTLDYTPERTGEHRFGLTNAGLADLYVDDVLLVDGSSNWERGDNFFGLGNVERRATMDLEAGRSYRVRIDYRIPPDSIEGIDVRAMRFGIEKTIGDAEIEEAVKRAAAAPLALLFVGRNGEWDTEGLDLPDMRLPGRQDELIERVAAVNPRTIVVLQTGGPVEMPWAGKVNAVVQFWYPGQEVGHAIADVLLGHAAPGGRLPQTFPAALADMPVWSEDPISYPGRDGHVRYDEGVFVGYRHFDRAGQPAPAYPFGFGLSYTSFAWGTASLSAPAIGDAGVEVTLEVTNTGARDGAEVVQLYVAPPAAPVARPPKELRGFAKLSLAPGQTGTARMRMRPRDLAYYDVDTGSFRAPAGTYRLILARDAASPVAELTLTLAEDWQEQVRRTEPELA